MLAGGGIGLCLASGAGPALATRTVTARIGQPGITASARTAAAAWWSTSGPSVLRRFHNGECTDWAARKRPDVIEHVLTHAYALSVVLGHQVVVDNWTAGVWTAHARWAHLPTGHRLQRGALMVFQRGSYAGELVGASHIAYVERVNRDGSFVISQMHAPRLWQVTQRTFPAYVSHMIGVSFIYR